MPVRDNLDEVLADYDDVMPRERHVLSVANVMEYARTLHDRHGYYVFNDEQLVQMVRRELAAAIEAGLPLTDRTIVNALDAAGFKYVKWLLRKTGGTQPPVRAGEGPRTARQGGWADVTGNLASGYRHRVDGRMVRSHAGLGPTPTENKPKLPF